MSTRLRVAALALVPLLVACSGPTDTPATSSPTPPASTAVATIPVGTTPTMTTWGETVELPGVGAVTFTRDGADAIVRLTAKAPGIRLGLSRAAYLEDVAVACTGEVTDGAPDGSVAMGRTSTVRYADCARGNQFAWNYMLDGERTLSVGVEEA